MSDPFRIIDAEVRGMPCKVFADTPDNLGVYLDALQAHADKEFIIDGERRWTFADIENAAARLAIELAGTHAIGPGDRVALALPNSAEWIISFLATVSLGAVPALINARSAPGELQHCIHSTQCKAWICDERAGEADIDEQIQKLTLAHLQEILSGTAEVELNRPTRAPDDEAVLMFTSGTTGLAKAASLSQQGMLTALKTIQYSGVLIAADMAKRYGIDLETLMQMRPPPVTLLMFPLFHVSGCNAVFLSNLMQGGKIVLMRRWDPTAAIDLIEAENISTFPAVPTMYWDLMNHAAETGRDISSLTSLSVGGQATPPALLTAVVDRFPQAVVGTGYGMTEASGTVTMSVGESFVTKPHSAGKPVATVQLEIRDDNGCVLETNETGEIFVRGAALMTGYANAEPPYFEEGGWFATGDVGYLDDDGDLCVVDRRTDMVISGGENIYCAEVERALDLHPSVRESAAFGESDDRLGERVVAVVCLEADQSASEEEILGSLDAHLARYKVPKKITITHTPLPRNPSGKIIKRQVRGDYT